PTLTLAPLSLHDALPISRSKHWATKRASCDETPTLNCNTEGAGSCSRFSASSAGVAAAKGSLAVSISNITSPNAYKSVVTRGHLDRKSTRLNSSHVKISY